MLLQRQNQAHRIQGNHLRAGQRGHKSAQARAASATGTSARVHGLVRANCPWSLASFVWECLASYPLCCIPAPVLCC
eukprot:356550-Chlamydomonas_euryale.AAC.10